LNEGVANRKIRIEASIKGDHPFITALIEWCLTASAGSERKPEIMLLGAPEFQEDYHHKKRENSVAIHTFFFRTSNTKNSVITGKAAMAIDSGQKCSGS
jgi:hypothetical protein